MRQIEQVPQREHMGENHVLKRILAEAFLRSRLVETETDLEELLRETMRKVDRAYHVQDRLLTEKEVAKRWPFLDVVRLRNYRYKAWIVSHYQLEPFIAAE